MLLDVAQCEWPVPVTIPSIKKDKMKERKIEEKRKKKKVREKGKVAQLFASLLS